MDSLCLFSSTSPMLNLPMSPSCFSLTPDSKTTHVSLAYYRTDSDDVYFFAKSSSMYFYHPHHHHPLPIANIPIPRNKYSSKCLAIFLLCLDNFFVDSSLIRCSTYLVVALALSIMPSITSLFVPRNIVFKSFLKSNFIVVVVVICLLCLNLLAIEYLRLLVVSCLGVVVVSVG